MKAIDALTINDEYRLKKKIVEYEEKLKDVPKVEQLESHLANKILEQEAIKKQLEKIQLEKVNDITLDEFRYNGLRLWNKYTSEKSKDMTPKKYILMLIDSAISCIQGSKGE